jgi:hypothetical protein
VNRTDFARLFGEIGRVQESRVLRSRGLNMFVWQSKSKQDLGTDDLLYRRPPGRAPRPAITKRSATVHFNWVAEGQIIVRSRKYNYGF